MANPPVPPAFPNLAATLTTSGGLIWPTPSTLNTSAAGAITLTAAQLLNGFFEHNASGAVTDTTDTGTAIDTAIGNATTGDAFMFALANTSGNTITLAGGTGVTLKGNTSLTTSKTALCFFRRTGSATYTCYVMVA